MNETSTPPTGQPGGPHDGPRVTRDQMKDVNRLRRPRQRVIAGVAAGIARHFDVDPLVVRVALVVLCFFGGAGLVLYAAGWLLMPEDGADQAPLHLDERSRTVALVIAVATATVALLGDTSGLYWFPWPLAVIAVVIWLVYSRRQDRLRQPPYGPPPGAPYGQPGPQPWAGTPYAPAAPSTGGPTTTEHVQAPPTAPYGTPYGQPYTEQVTRQATDQATQKATQQAAPYAAAYGPGSPYTGAPVPPRPPLTRPRDPRRRGPILFGFTLALVALAMGILGTVDLAGADVVASAYPALALTVVSVMLVVGSFWGRAGGLVLLALIAAAVTVGTTANESWSTERVRHTPTSAAEVRTHYELRQGDLVVDLSRVGDVENLDGRRVQADIGAGRLEVVVPDDVNVRVDADVGVGAQRVLGERERGGLGVSHSYAVAADDATAETPVLRLDLDAGMGEIVVRRASALDDRTGRAGPDAKALVLQHDDTRQEALR